MSVRTIEHKIAAGSQFNGLAAAGSPTLVDDLETYPEGVSGGLFNFNHPSPLKIVQVAIKFGGQSAWTLNLVDRDGVEVELLSGSTETSLVDTACNAIVLQDQYLKLTTTGATTAMRARISLSRKVE